MPGDHQTNIDRSIQRTDRLWLDLAARAAYRATGAVEPNPLVGCVIVPAGVGDPKDAREARRLAAEGVVALGHHRVFGGPHAEIDALEACTRLGISPKGARVYVTLEPCNGWGKTGPCSEALVRAQVASVVCARRDPAEGFSGGAETLSRAGIACRFTGASAAAIALADPFVHRLETGLPWLIGKWAQTLDGRSATSSGESQWLTGPRARRSAHLLRGRVDAILTGVGTVLADDPRLTVRGVPARRVPRRVIIDPALETPPSARVLERSVSGGPVSVVCAADAPADLERALVEAGAEVRRFEREAGALPMRSVLEWLAGAHGVAAAMTEAGPRLMGRLLSEGLVCELRAYAAPLVFADPAALPAFLGPPVPALADSPRWRLALARRLGDDIELRYRAPIGQAE